jgi:sporulation protein YlmC with PRC-barrel domain
MTEAAEFDIGSEVLCSDGVCGDLRQVVVDPVARAITHLVVEPRHRRHGGHLVPVELVASTGKEIQLSCTLAELAELDTAEEDRFVAGGGGEWGYNETESVSHPYTQLGVGTMGMGGMGMGGTGVSGLGVGRHEVFEESIPVGEVEVRRGDPVQAVDGPIGHIGALVVDPRDHHVTHVLLDEGHLWGKKRVAIPIGAVKRLDVGITVEMTIEQIEALPPVDVE